MFIATIMFVVTIMSLTLLNVETTVDDVDSTVDDIDSTVDDVDSTADTVFVEASKDDHSR